MFPLVLSLLILFTTLLESKGSELQQRQFYTLYKWSRGINMTFPTLEDQQFAINNGFYNVSRIQLPVDIELEYGGNFFKNNLMGFANTNQLSVLQFGLVCLHTYIFNSLIAIC